MKLQKETSKKNGSSQAARHGRWYDDACGTAFAMELVGERWTLLIVRELMFGPRRFSDLRASLPGISAKTLTERLQAMQGAGIALRRELPSPGRVQVYELTEWGYRAEIAVMELGRWAALSPGHDPTLPLSAASMMMSLRTMLLRDALMGEVMTIGFDIGGETFLARLANGELSIRREPVDKAEAIFRTPVAAVLAALFYGDIPAEVLEAEAGLTVEGDRDLTSRFARLFTLPEKMR